MEAMQEKMDELSGHLDGTIDYVLGQVKDMFKVEGGERGIIDGIQAFVAAVDWTEPWILALGVFHLSVFACVFLSRHSGNAQGFIFCALLGMIWAAEHLNSVAADNWEAFSTQNYFDKHGLFLSVIYSGPLMFATIAVLVLSLVNTTRMLIVVKRAELKSRARKRAQEEKAA
eukprot:CAMPEP_0182863812 /NCGR_PEP_ID=MMETSP0034_2-20130328/6850_1 /TAXON_ID=156128 /ORGANISM="Nephroselmis pyriformis, Strain CCMP717" /LENGTH=171 /DNA_ID=CAMNT_0024996051 /DNA_START=58 /DNA_END=569 /DNA_ORIENTATION=-